MIYFVIINTICSLVAQAAVIPNESEANIVTYENTNDGDGNYKFSFKTSNGIIREESGHLVHVGQEDEHMVVKGSYSYIDVDGKTVIVNYTADENGYRIISSPPPAPVRMKNEKSSLMYLPPGVIASLLGK